MKMYNFIIPLNVAEVFAQCEGRGRLAGSRSLYTAGRNILLYVYIYSCSGNLTIKTVMGGLPGQGWQARGQDKEKLLLRQKEGRPDLAHRIL